LEFVKATEKMTNKEAVNFLNQFLQKQKNAQNTDKKIGKNKVKERNPCNENLSVQQNIKDYEKIIDNALVGAKNRREFISNLKDSTQNNNVSFRKNLLKLDNKTLVLGVDTKITKAEILLVLKNNVVKYSEDIDNE